MLRMKYKKQGRVQIIVASIRTEYILSTTLRPECRAQIEIDLPQGSIDVMQSSNFYVLHQYFHGCDISELKKKIDFPRKAYRVSVIKKEINVC